MADSPLNDLTVAELRELADAKGVEVAKSANKADLVAALETEADEPSADPATPDAPEADEPAAPPAEGDEPAVETVQPEEAEIVDLTPVEVLTVVVGDASAVLLINDQQFALSPTDVDQARRLLDQAYYQLH